MIDHLKDGIETGQFPLIDACTKDDVLEIKQNIRVHRCGYNLHAGRK